MSYEEEWGQGLCFGARREDCSSQFEDEHTVGLYKLLFFENSFALRSGSGRWASVVVVGHGVLFVLFYVYSFDSVMTSGHANTRSHRL